MKYAEVENWTDEQCFEKAYGGPVEIAKRCFLRKPSDTFTMLELHPTRRFTVASAKAWLKRSGSSLR